MRIQLAPLTQRRVKADDGLTLRPGFHLGNSSDLCRHGQLQQALRRVQYMVQQGNQISIVNYAYLLKECRRMKALLEGMRVHAMLVEGGYHSNVFLGNTLVDMYFECGSIEDAHQLFDGMPVHNVSAWNVIISAHIKQGKHEQALELFQKMQQAGNKANSSTIVFLLKAYANLANWEQIKQVHVCIIQCDLDLDLYVGSTLIDIYAKLGNIEDACQVFKKLYDRDVVVWNVMIACYTHQGLGEKALSLFDQMQQDGVKPNNVTFVSILKVCSITVALEMGRRIHALIIASGFESNMFLESSLLDMYANCGSILDAWDIFNKTYIRDVVLWNAMITGYAENMLVKEALALFAQLKQEGLKPNNLTIVSILKACARGAALKQGKQVHAQIIGSAFQSDLLVLNTLADMYAKCQCLEYARDIFNNMHERNVISWNVMLMGYAEEGLGMEAVSLFEQMQQEGMKADGVTFNSVLKACASLASLQLCRHIHAYITTSCLESEVLVGCTLIDMYATCMSIEDACIAFKSADKGNKATWNAMIAAYTQQGLGKEAFNVLDKMQHGWLKPDAFTFASILKACAAVDQGKGYHLQIVSSGFEKDAFVQSSLIIMYANCGSIEDACQVFHQISNGDVVCWNGMIAAYTQYGMWKEAIATFEQMQQAGLQLSKVTFISIIKACASVVDIERGKQVHTHLIQSGFQSDIVVANTLVDMYVKCGSIDKACEVFNNMAEQVVVSWNVMIAGYAQCGLKEETFGLFERMQQMGMEPDRVTFISILKACTMLVALDSGKQLHAIIRESIFEPDVSVKNALIQMYGKCGNINDARNVFNKMHKQDIVSWNAMIAEYAHQGLSKEALTLFEQMQCMRISPDEATFSCALSACIHGGLLMEGCHYFDLMVNIYGLTPTMQHYACMVDILGRAGCLSEAEDFINKIPMQPNTMVWMALLRACRVHGSVEKGRHAFAHVIKSEPKKVSAYVLLSNIYAALGMWDEVVNLRMRWTGCE